MRQKGLWDKLNKHFFEQISDRDLDQRLKYYEGSFLYKKGLYKQSLDIFENIKVHKQGIDRAVTLNRIAQNYLHLR